MECPALWGEPDHVGVEVFEQLHATVPGKGRGEDQQVHSQVPFINILGHLQCSRLHIVLLGLLKKNTDITVNLPWN